ncbi:hypothetical protein ES288_A06G125300v1 [Gossypium darwinii]|uniref:Uncharacterized protein n=1 Tax=Gossypium darwinii TaxID=34276 RepID=A0A5D2G5P2_GOSDA|nr:hypothetical protein ES288_A06G125300v1 [Gossypium darwinii]
MANGKLVSWFTLRFFFGLSGSTITFPGFLGMIIMVLKHQVLSNILAHSLVISENHARKMQTQHSSYSDKKKREQKVGIPGNT